MRVEKLIGQLYQYISSGGYLMKEPSHLAKYDYVDDDDDDDDYDDDNAGDKQQQWSSSFGGKLIFRSEIV